MKQNFIGKDGEVVFRRWVMHPGLPARPFMVFPTEALGEMLDSCAQFFWTGAFEYGASRLTWRIAGR